MATRRTKSSKAKASKTPAKRTATPAPTGSAAEFERFLPEAKKIAKRAIRPFHADVSLATTNAQRGVKAVLAKKAQVQAELPAGLVSRIQALEGLGLAVAYAGGQVERFAPPPKPVRQMLSRAHELRATMLDSAKALASAGLLPANAVRQIRHGHGGIDAAGDCVALATLFRKNAATIRGKHPITAAQIQEAAKVGTELLGVLEPRGAGRGPASLALRQARDNRDRLWTLFVQRWEEDVWRAGAWLFGRAVDDHVPPLLSRSLRRRPAKKKAAATVNQGAAQ